MAYTCVFKRYEKKYRINEAMAEALKAELSDVLIPDAYGKSTVGNLYLDTPDDLLIRQSLNAISYKEKLRIRSYGIPRDDSTVFLELKKKYRGVVYKRRVAFSLSELNAFLANGKTDKRGQIMEELTYALRFYRHPRPRGALFYEREAFFYRDEDGVRLTFDRGIRYRFTDLSPTEGTDGQLLLPDDAVILEIKCGGAMPLRLAHLLDQYRLFPVPFSKYGNAYQARLRAEGMGTAPIFLS